MTLLQQICHGIICKNGNNDNDYGDISDDNDDKMIVIVMIKIMIKKYDDDKNSTEKCEPCA